MFHIEAPSATMTELERNMGLNEDILRHLTIKLDQFPEGPSVMMHAKSERVDKGRRSDKFEDRNPNGSFDDLDRPLGNGPIESLVPNEMSE
jgi:small subunit ribosomal protein S6